MVIRSGQTKQCNWLFGLSSVPPGTSGAKPGHLGVPKTTFGIPGQSVPNRACPGKTGTIGQLVHPWSKCDYHGQTIVYLPWYNHGGFCPGTPIDPPVNLDKSPEVDEWLSKSGPRINSRLFNHKPYNIYVITIIVVLCACKISIFVVTIGTRLLNVF